MAKPQKLCLKDLNDLQRLKEENKLLKKQIKALRNSIKRAESSVKSHKNLEELVKKQKKEDESFASSEGIKAKWICHECSRGYLKLTIINRHDGQFYYRRCTDMQCKKRTRLKSYHSNVEDS